MPKLRAVSVRAVSWQRPCSRLSPSLAERSIATPAFKLNDLLQGGPLRLSRGVRK